MKLHIGNLYWPAVSPQIPLLARPWTDKDYDVLIVGAGMSGAISAYRLSRAGYRVLLIDRATVASGSTAANTGLIQYMSDRGVAAFAEKIGKERATYFYDLSRRGVETLTAIHEELGDNPLAPDFDIKRSLILASEEDAVEPLTREYEAQEALDYEPEAIDAETLKQKGVAAYFGLGTGPDIALNPYAFVQRMVAHAQMNFGLEVAEYVRYEGAEPVNPDDPSEGYLATLDAKGQQHRLEVPKILIAAGYDPPSAIREQLKHMRLFRSYVFVTDLLKDVKMPDRLAWEDKDPYTYFRYTFEDRIMVGGMDIEGETFDPATFDARIDALRKDIPTLVPDLREDTPVSFTYAAVFGESDDELPYLGVDPRHPGIFILCGLGGNGTVYSAIGSDLVLRWMDGDPLDDKGLFRIDR